MFFNTRVIILATLASTLTNALPFDAQQPRNIVPRAKSYSVINVDGGATTEAPVEATKTIEVVNPGPTVTAKVTTTVVEPAPVPVSPSTTSSASSSATSSSTRTTKNPPTTTVTPKPVFVTVTVTTDDGPTEYYDNGMWHTSYRIKTFEAAATPSLLSTTTTAVSSATDVPAW